jgi:hypothetical protein
VNTPIEKFELNVLTLLVTRLTVEAKNAIVEPVTLVSGYKLNKIN